MRLFVAIIPPGEVLDHLGAAVAGVQALADDAMTWTTQEQWHLTLTFLGEVDDVRRDRVQARLARAASRSPPLHLAIARAGVFGSRQRPQVLWAGVDGDVAPLRRLAESAGAAARRSGIPVEERRYRPHVTLARCRRPFDVGPVLERLSSYVGPAWTAERLHLVRSHLGQGEGRRARYESLVSWPLAGTGAGDG